MNIYISGSLSAWGKQQKGWFFFLTVLYPKLLIPFFFAVSDLFADAFYSRFCARYFLNISSDCLILNLPLVHKGKNLYKQ